MPLALGQTITVVNKSGKVVKTSKHLTNLFKEAKSAYLEKKAELKVSKDDDLQRKISAGMSVSRKSSPGAGGPPRSHLRNDAQYNSRHSSRRSSYDDGRDVRHGGMRRQETDRRTPERRRSDRRDDMRGDRDRRDDRRRESSREYERRDDRRDRERRDYDSADDHRRTRDYDRRDDDRRSSGRTTRRERHGKPPVERGYSDSFYVNDLGPSKRTNTTPLTSSNLRHASYASSTGSFDRAEITRSQLTRRRSDSDGLAMSSRRGHSRRGSATSSLAFGEMPPPLPERHVSEEVELRNKMSALQVLLQEANCVQHSAKAVMKQLENNPDAMAAVALTLAEISNLATKMAPGALMSLKSSFPVVMALLLSPEFLIAGGVALGVTIVSFGGYKIIKRIKRKKLLKAEKGEAVTVDGSDDDDGLEEVEELSQIDRIEQWRRGLADPETLSVASSVEGTYVTPKASKILREEGVLPPKDSKSKAVEKAVEKEPKDAKREREKRDKEDEKARKTKEKSDKKEEKAKSKQLQIAERGEKEDMGSVVTAATSAQAAAASIKAMFKRKGEVIA